jgi:osmotically-inducible protein OsmY
MLRLFAALLMLSSSLCFGRAPMQIPGQPSRGNPPTMPDPNAPDTKAPKKHQTSSKDAQQELQKALDNKNVVYRGSNIQTKVDDQTVTLTGSVTSSMQHEMALQLARAYGDDRKIVDKLVIQP